MPTQPAFRVVDLIDLDAVGTKDVAPLSREVAESVVPAIGIASRPVASSARALVEALALTIAPSAPGSTFVPGDAATARQLLAAATADPHATAALLAVLGSTDSSSVSMALKTESLAYSTLLAGEEFARWRHERPIPPGSRRLAPNNSSPDRWPPRCTT